MRDDYERTISRTQCAKVCQISECVPAMSRNAGFGDDIFLLVAKVRAAKCTQPILKEIFMMMLQKRYRDIAE